MSAGLRRGMAGFNRVLGGGVRAWVWFWWGGDPREVHPCFTVSTQLSHRGHAVLYVSGEESAEQIKLRAGVSVILTVSLALTLRPIKISAQGGRPTTIIDRTVMSRKFQCQAPLSQVREGDSRAHANWPKANNISWQHISLVTWPREEGATWGHSNFGHMVDTVLLFWGANVSTRILRKSRTAARPIGDWHLVE